jgi:hypothetical protein
MGLKLRQGVEFIKRDFIVPVPPFKLVGIFRTVDHAPSGRKMMVCKLEGYHPTSVVLSVDRRLTSFVARRNGDLDFFGFYNTRNILTQWAIFHHDQRREDRTVYCLDVQTNYYRSSVQVILPWPT